MEIFSTINKTKIMKYLKTFEGYNDKSLAREIAEDLLPRLNKIRDEKGIFTVSMFDNYMEERKGDMRLTDEVISELVDLGFQFDSDDDDDDDFQNYPPDGFEGYPGMEYSLN
jgi:hypothetical protein